MHKWIDRVHYWLYSKERKEMKRNFDRSVECVRDPLRGPPWQVLCVFASEVDRWMNEYMDACVHCIDPDSWPETLKETLTPLRSVSGVLFRGPPQVFFCMYVKLWLLETLELFCSVSYQQRPMMIKQRKCLHSAQGSNPRMQGRWQIRLGPWKSNMNSLPPPQYIQRNGDIILCPSLPRPGTTNPFVYTFCFTTLTANTRCLAAQQNPAASI